MKSYWIWALTPVALIALVAGLLRFGGSKDSARSGAAALVMYCAAGVKPPVEAASEQFEQELGQSVDLQYGGSGTLLSNLKVARRGDLYLAADASYLQIALTNGLVNEILPVARLTPVIAVKKGNPKGILGLRDLLRVDVALANPDAAAIGRTTRELLREAGLWEKLEPQVRVFKPTVNEVANDVKLGTVDAGMIWDATVRQYPELEAVEGPTFRSKQQEISIGVLVSSEQPENALRFARYLTAQDKGLKEFERWGYEPVEGALWGTEENEKP